MNNFTKTLTGGAALLALTLGSVTPAMAAPGRDGGHKGDGISAGEVIAGAVILGGLAAVIGGALDDDDKHDRRYDDRGYSTGYGYDDAGYHGDRRGRGYDDRDPYYGRGQGRDAVEQCVRAAENGASYRGQRADVTDVGSIDRTRYGYKIKGTIRIEENRRYDRWDRNDRYGRSSDKGKFTCYVERGRVTDIDFSGLRNLR